MRDVVIGTVGMSRFQKRPEVDVAEIGAEIVAEVLLRANLRPEDIPAGFCGSMFGGSLIGQRVFQLAGISGAPVVNVENACASGATAFSQACAAVQAGQYDLAVVVGVDKLSSLGGGALPLNPTDPEVSKGSVMPSVYAMRAQRYLFETGLAAEELAHVVVKNRGNGAKNPNAHFQAGVEFDEVITSRMVADPLTLLQCCANSDGAAVALVGTRDALRGLGLDLVTVLASVVQSGRFSNGARDLTRPDISVTAVQAAYSQAELKPRDLDLAEVHDAFSIGELLYYEVLGLSDRETAMRDLKQGDFDIDGRVAVNPSGGLLSRGHPIGATGVAQLCEAYWQLTGEAGGRQITGPSVAMTHVTGGGIAGVDNGACSVHILTA